MKKLLFGLIIFASFIPIKILAQQYWMQHAICTTIDEGTGVSSDAAGNTYATGYFTTTATFGTFALNSAGVEDIYLTKLNNNGVFQWAVKAGGPGSDRPTAIKTDAAGNSYITGFYYGTATFGSFNITSSGLQDIFIAKYDNTGTCLWAKSAGGTEGDIGNSITVDASGNVIVTGQFTGTATFGTFTLVSTGNNTNVFTTKLDGNGNFLWAKKGSGPQTDRGLGVSCDAGGNVYITGQFSDTITFDIVHANNMMNAIFVVKYNSAGAEQWFCRAGGGGLDIANAIAVDNAGNPVITGDFTGPMSIIATSGTTTLTNLYPNRIFAINFAGSSGALTWSIAHGSNGNITSKDIVTDASGNSFIVGSFECRLNQYADQYGQGTFNSVGYWDIFVTKLNNAGVWQWSRQAGGHGNEKGTGIALNSSGKVLLTGSFDNDLIIPEEYSQFLGYNTVTDNGCTPSYCSDADYSQYEKFTTSGNIDLFIANAIDLNRQPYDYYDRSGAGCNRPVDSVCINDGSGNICMDTAKFCQSGDLYAKTNTCPGIGPTYTYHWSTGSSAYSAFVSVSGYYYVTQTSTDGCFVTTDSIYVKILPAPAIPTISDNHNINVNAINTTPIILCLPNSALLTGGNYGNDSIHWSGPNGNSNTNTILATTSGVYYFTIVDSNGCSRTNSVQVTFDSAFANMAPKMICLTTPLMHDSLTLCTGQTFTMYIYDTLSNPNANDTCPPYSQVFWQVTPTTITYSSPTPCPTNTFTPQDSGWYTITSMWVRHNICDTDTFYASYTIHINLLPDTTLPQYTMTIVGPTSLCPGGDTILLVVSGTPSYLWNTGSTNDSIYVSTPGTYSCSYSLTVTNSYGCTASTSAGASHTVIIKPQPTLTMNPQNGVICPGDSIQITCNGTGTFLWQGPNGPFGGNNNPVYISQPGSYYCTLTDTSGCVLVSNTVVVTQYSTPYLQVSNPVFCPGDTVTITIQTNPNSIVQWQPPLSGSSLTQHVTIAGTYTCIVTSCGINTTVSVTVTMANPIALITANGPLTFCSGDSVILSANGGEASYLWNPGAFNVQNITVFTSGSYILTTTDSNGCTAHDTVAIIVTPPYTTPTLSISPDTVFCPGDSVLITVVTNSLSNIQWQFPLSGSSFTQEITTPGTYACSVSYCNITTTDSIHIYEAHPTAHITPLGPLTFCGGDSVILDGNSGMSAYNWFPTNVSQQNYVVYNSGLYTLQTTDAYGCQAQDTITINVIPNDAPVLNDTTICANASVLLTAYGTPTIEWYYSPNSTTPFNLGYTYTTPILDSFVTYYIMTNSVVCRSSLVPVTVYVEYCPPTVPNVFTPNGDGKNDIWTFETNGLKGLKVRIYDRWGLIVYEWSGTAGGWDGHVLNTGLYAPDGTYYWIADFVDLFNKSFSGHGFVELIRNK